MVYWPVMPVFPISNQTVSDSYGADFEIMVDVEFLNANVIGLFSPYFTYPPLHWFLLSYIVLNWILSSPDFPPVKQMVSEFNFSAVIVELEKEMNGLVRMANPKSAFLQEIVFSFLLWIWRVNEFYWLQEL